MRLKSIKIDKNIVKRGTNRTCIDIAQSARIFNIYCKAINRINLHYKPAFCAHLTAHTKLKLPKYLKVKFALYDIFTNDRTITFKI